VLHAKDQGWLRLLPGRWVRLSAIVKNLKCRQMGQQIDEIPPAVAIALTNLVRRNSVSTPFHPCGHTRDMQFWTA